MHSKKEAIRVTHTQALMTTNPQPIIGIGALRITSVTTTRRKRMHQQQQQPSSSSSLLPRLSMIGEPQDFSYFQSLQYPTTSPLTTSSSLSGLMQSGHSQNPMYNHTNYPTNNASISTNNHNHSGGSNYSNNEQQRIGANSVQTVNDNEHETATTDTSPNFHPIACEQCRKVHKFCSMFLSFTYYSYITDMC